VVRVAEAGLTLTDATGTGVTVNAAAPFFPSLVAVIVTEPTASPLTRPLPFTPASAVLPLDHVTARPESALPLASLGIAVSCAVCPTATLGEGGLTLTDATGAGAGVTVNAAAPFFPSLVAVIVADPAAMPVTAPLPLTVASAELLLTQVTTRPESGVPFASLGVAVSWIGSPTLTLADAGVTLTDATGRGRMRTRDEADSLSAALVPKTRKSPAIVSAANIPSGVMLPPVALQLTVTTVLSPLGVRPYAANFIC
jgi:hypothetical protein